MKYFTKEHEWVELIGDLAVIGISIHAAEELGDITFIELPEVEDVINKSDQISTVESVKTAEDIYSPIGGTIAEVNTSLEDEPELVNESAEEKGWIVKLSNFSKDDLDGLMSEDEYKQYIED